MERFRFRNQFQKRLNLMDVKESHVTSAVDKLVNKIDESFLENLDFLKEK